MSKDQPSTGHNRHDREESTDTPSDLQRAGVSTLSGQATSSSHDELQGCQYHPGRDLSMAHLEIQSGHSVSMQVGPLGLSLGNIVHVQPYPVLVNYCELNVHRDGCDEEDERSRSESNMGVYMPLKTHGNWRGSTSLSDSRFLLSDGVLAHPSPHRRSRRPWTSSQPCGLHQQLMSSSREALPVLPRSSSASHSTRSRRELR